MEGRVSVGSGDRARITCHRSVLRKRSYSTSIITVFTKPADLRDKHTTRQRPQKLFILVLSLQLLLTDPMVLFSRIVNLLPHTPQVTDLFV